MICYLIRHGKDDNTIRGGWSDTPLTEQGKLEVEILANKLSNDLSLNITQIFSSDLMRAKQTAEIISSSEIPSSLSPPLLKGIRLPSAPK